MVKNIGNEIIRKKLQDYYGAPVTMTEEGWLIPFSARKKIERLVLPDNSRLVGKYGEYSVYDMTGSLTTTLEVPRTYNWLVVAGPGAKMRMIPKTYKSKEKAISNAIHFMRRDAEDWPARAIGPGPDPELAAKSQRGRETFRKKENA